MNGICVILCMLPLQRAVWLLPVATVLHFLEEAPGFTRWAQRFAPPRYTVSSWARVHSIGLAYAIAFVAAVALFLNPLVAFLFFPFCFSETVFNAVFHLGATLRFGTYCPGLATALALYPALFWYVSRVAFQEGLLTWTGWLTAFAIAAPIHLFDVAKNVFLVECSGTPTTISSVYRRRVYLSHFTCR